MTYEVKLHARVREVTLYKGDDEQARNAAFSGAEGALKTTRQSAEIEIVENGKSHWIEYAKGVRVPR